MNELALVVGAVIVDKYPGATRLLAARRTRPPELAGQWEFPGGKVEPGESPEQALVREIDEELDVHIAVLEELSPPSGGSWPASNGYRMRLYYAVIESGTPQIADGHDDVRWLEEAELLTVPWLASDRRPLSHISLSRHGGTVDGGK